MLPLNWKEIFSWYWEQKGVENPERFLEENNQIDKNQLLNLYNAILQNPELLNLQGNNSETLNDAQNQQGESQSLNDVPVEEQTLQNLDNGEIN